MAQLFTNFAATTLATPALATDTEINVVDGSLFPAPAGEDFFQCVLASAGQELTREIVRVNARVGNTLTVVRAQEGTVAAEFAEGDKAELRDTALFMSLMAQMLPINVEAPLTGSGTLVDPLGIPVATNTETGTLPVPSPAGGASKFLREDMSWVAPDGGSGDIVSTLVESEVAINTTATLQLNKMHVCSGTTADYTVTLPPVAGNAGKIIGVRMSMSLTKYVTVKGDGTELIDGTNTRLMWAGESAILLCDGVVWSKIAGKTIGMIGRLYNTNAISFAAGTAVKIDTNATDFGNLGDTATKRITIKRPGRGTLMLDCVMNNTGNASTYVELRAYTDGGWTDTVRTFYTANQYSNPYGQKLKGVSAGMYFEMYLYYATGTFTTSVLLANASIMSFQEMPQW